MLKPQQSEFLEACRAALADGTFKKVVFGRRAAESGGKYRAEFELVVGGRNQFVDFSDTYFKVNAAPGNYNASEFTGMFNVPITET